MSKIIKEHIIETNGKSFVCGSKFNSNKKQSFIALFVEGILYNSNLERVTYKNMDTICLNCLKQSHPTLWSDLLNQKAIAEFKATLPKNNFERVQLDKENRKQQNKQAAIDLSKTIFFKSYFQAEKFLTDNPVPITEPTRLLPLPESFNCKDFQLIFPKDETGKPLKEYQLISQTFDLDYNKPVSDYTWNNPIEGQVVEEETNELVEDALIQFNEKIHMVHGIGNHWQVISYNENGQSESITDWIDYDAAYEEAIQWATV